MNSIIFYFLFAMLFSPTAFPVEPNSVCISGETLIRAFGLQADPSLSDVVWMKFEGKHVKTSERIISELVRGSTYLQGASFLDFKDLEKKA